MYRKHLAVPALASTFALTLIAKRWQLSNLSRIC